MDINRLLNQTTTSRDKRARESSQSSGEGDKNSPSGSKPEAKKARTKDFASGQGLEPKEKEVVRTGSPEGSQEQEKDDTGLVLDNIQTKTAKRLNQAIGNMLQKRAIFSIKSNYHDKALELERNSKKVFRFLEGKKGISRDDAYAAMSQLLQEVPRMPTASTNVTRFLREVEQIKQNIPEQAEGGTSGS